MPKFSNDEEDEGVTLLSDNPDAEAALQTAAKSAGLKGSELAQFMAQTRHESWDFSKMKEVGSKKTFAKYEKPKMAKRLGNKVKGDGELFKGRGFIQLTGRDNYSQFAASVGLTIDEAVADLETLDGAIESACWFWKKNGLNAICDKDDIVLMTKRINGGTIGLEDRKKHYEHAKHVLA